MALVGLFVDFSDFVGKLVHMMCVFYVVLVLFWLPCWLHSDENQPYKIYLPTLVVSCGQARVVLFESALIIYW